MPCAAALNEQLRALEQLSSLSARERRDVQPAGPAAASARRRRCTAAMPPRPARRRRPRRCRPTTAASAGRWAICSPAPRATTTALPARPCSTLQGIAGALDPTTASAIWSRFRAGQRGIMVRCIYTAEGRASFDEVTRALRPRHGLPPHRRPLPRRLRAAGSRYRAAKPARRARPPRLRRRPRLSLPGPRQRAAALTLSSPSPRLRGAGWTRTPCRRSTIEAVVETWPIAGEFVIARGAKREATVVVAEVSDGTVVGRGECVPYARYGETVEGVRDAILAMRGRAVRPRRACCGSCRRAPRAMRSTARCGTTRPSAPALRPRQLGGPGAAAARSPPAYTISLDSARGDGRQGRRRGRAPCRS